MAENIALLKLRAKAKAKADRQRFDVELSQQPTEQELENQEFEGIKGVIKAISPKGVELFDRPPETPEAQKARLLAVEQEQSIVESITGDPLKPVIGVGAPVAIPPGAKVGESPPIAEPLQAAFEVVDVVRRGLGAVAGEIPFIKDLVGRKEGQSFLAAVGDQQTGIFKKIKEIVQTSNQPEAVKLVEDFTLTVLEDPLIWLTGFFKGLGTLAQRGTQRLSRKAVQETGVKAGTEIAERAAVTGAPAAKGPLAPKFKFTPAQQLQVQGKPIPKALIAKERKALGTTKQIGDDVAESLAKDNFEVVAEKLSDIRTKFVLGDEPVEALRVATKESLEKLHVEFIGKMKGAFRAIDSKLDDFGNIGDEAIGIVSSKIDDVTKSTGKKIPTTPDEIADALRKGELDLGGGGRAKITGGVATPKTAAQLGLESTTMKIINNIKVRLKEGVPFSILKEERTKLGNRIWGREANLPITDYKALKKVYEGMTDAMKDVVGKNLGDDVLREWDKTNRIFSAGTDDFKITQKIFNKKTPNIIISDLASKSGKSVDAGIKSLKRVLPEESFNTFRNMYFNKLIEKATKKGNIDGDALVRVLKEQPQIVFNEVFDAKMIDDVIELGRDAIAAKVARELSIKPTLSKSFVDQMASNPVLRFMMFRSGVSSTRIILSEIGRTAGKDLLKKRAAGKAADFLRQTDEAALIPQFLKGLVEGVGVSGAVQAPRISVTPENR